MQMVRAENCAAGRTGCKWGAQAARPIMGVVLCPRATVQGHGALQGQGWSVQHLPPGRTITRSRRPRPALDDGDLGGRDEGVLGAEEIRGELWKQWTQMSPGGGMR
jgi:hypothetical protein